MPNKKLSDSPGEGCVPTPRTSPLAARVRNGNALRLFAQVSWLGAGVAVSFISLPPLPEDLGLRNPPSAPGVRPSADCSENRRRSHFESRGIFDNCQPTSFQSCLPSKPPATAPSKAE